MLQYASLLIGFVLLVSACGGSDSADTTTTQADVTTTTVAATTTTAETTTTAGAGGGATEPIVPGENADADEIANVYAVVFDSKTTFEEKAPLIVDPDGLEATVEEYTAAGAGVGDIFLEATAVSVDGDAAVVIYDLQFGGQVFQPDQTGDAVRPGGAWQVTREHFCSVMMLARVSCP